MCYTAANKMINEIKYQGRLGDIYYFVHHLIKKGLNQWTELTMIRERSGGVSDLLRDPEIWKNEKTPREEMITKINDQIYKENTAKVKNYKKWVINYGLIMLCSVFDQFLWDLLNSALEKNPDLSAWTTKEEILADFEHRNIKEKKRIIVNKLKINEQEFFDFSIFIQEVQTKFGGTGFKDLFEIYEKRDKASHTDTYTLDDMNDFLHIKELFEKLIFILSLKFRKKWAIETEMYNLFKKSK